MNAESHSPRFEAFLAGSMAVHVSLLLLPISVLSFEKTRSEPRREIEVTLYYLADAPFEAAVMPVRAPISIEPHALEPLVAPVETPPRIEPEIPVEPKKPEPVTPPVAVEPPRVVHQEAAEVIRPMAPPMPLEERPSSSLFTPTSPAVVEAHPPPATIEDRRFGQPLAPSFRNRVPPEYPALARRLSREGRVSVRLHIGADGSLQSIELLSSDRDDFTAAAFRALRASTYHPARDDADRPVASRARLTIRFSLENTR
jgi:TonB family protein